jgi:hypothetical protein
VDELDSAIEVCLQQGTDWKKVAREAVANIGYPPTGTVRPTAVAARGVRQRQHSQLCAVRRIAEGHQPSRCKRITWRGVGWLKWQLAEYVQFTDAVRAQQVLKGALLLNRRLTKPIDGLTTKSSMPGHAAGQQRRGPSPTGKKTDLLVRLNGVLDDLAFFKPDNANEFEAAMQEVAAFLPGAAAGAGIQARTGRAVGRRQSALLCHRVQERCCGAEDHQAPCQPAQRIDGLVRQRYDHTCMATPVMVHPYRVLEAAASGHADARVLTTGRLAALKDSIRAFCTAAASSWQLLTRPMCKSY